MVVGHDLAAGQQLQHVVPPHTWFGAVPGDVTKQEGAAQWALVGCTVAPGGQGLAWRLGGDGLRTAVACRAGLGWYCWLCAARREHACTPCPTSYADTMLTSHCNFSCPSLSLQALSFRPLSLATKRGCLQSFPRQRRGLSASWLTDACLRRFLAVPDDGSSVFCSACATQTCEGCSKVKQAASSGGCQRTKAALPALSRHS